MKLIKTDHGEQALVLDEKTNLIIQQSITFFYHYKIGSVALRKKSMELLTFISSPDNRDQPTFFQKFYKLNLCDSCKGSGSQIDFPDDRNKEPEFGHCSICSGHGRLYVETIVKGYPPTTEHLRKIAR